jgi:hypothetical protein
VSNAEVGELIAAVGQQIAKATATGATVAAASGTALGLEAKTLIDAHANNVKADADWQWVHESNLNKQQIAKTQQDQQQGQTQEHKTESGRGFAYESLWRAHEAL